MGLFDNCIGRAKELGGSNGKFKPTIRQAVQNAVELTSGVADVVTQTKQDVTVR